MRVVEKTHFLTALRNNQEYVCYLYASFPDPDPHLYYVLLCLVWLCMSGEIIIVFHVNL